MSQPTQMSIDQLHTCPRCKGTGKEVITTKVIAGPSTRTIPCRVCRGSRVVSYDPQDTSIGY